MYGYAGAHRGGQHDPAAGLHPRNRRLSGEQLAGDVDPEHPIETSRGDGFQRTEVLYAGVAGQQVDPAERVRDALHQVLGLGGIADVGAECRGLASVAGELLDERVGRLGICHIVDGYRGAFSGQPAHDRRADSPASAGHQCSLTGEPPSC